MKNKKSLVQQARDYVNKLNPQSSSEARGYFMDFWDNVRKSEVKPNKAKKMLGKHPKKEMKGLKKLKTDASSVLGEMVVDILDSKDSLYWSDLKYAKKIWRIIDKASKLKKCSCLPCGCNTLGKIYCEQHYQKFYGC